MKPQGFRNGSLPLLFLLLYAGLLAAAPAAANPIDDPGAFVRQHYDDFLQREADVPGEAYWTGEITQCGGDAACMARKRVDVARAFFFCSEFIQLEPRLADSARNTPDYNEAFVDAAYRRYWRRDRPSWDTWVAYLNSGIPNADYNTVIDRFINDERYRGRFAGPYFTRSLDANRNRLFADWAARQGYTNLCQAWESQSCSAKGVFLTLTHRLQVSYMGDGNTPLDHVNGMYAMLGDGWDGNHCGGDDNRIFVQMDPYLRNAMVLANGNVWTTTDQNGQKYWTKSGDFSGPHAPFDASNATSYGHPRGQMHFWKSSSGASTPVWSTGVYGVIDLNIMEIDQDYDVTHPSSTECSYDTDGCDTCGYSYEHAAFSFGPGQMIYERQHPYIPGWFAGPDYDWAPAGCERQWCGGCKTCEAVTSWGFRLGHTAQWCYEVPCDGNQPAGYVCTLDGVKKVCTPPYGWVAVEQPPQPTCDPGADQNCWNIGGSFDDDTCTCTTQCQPDPYCTEYDYATCTCYRY